MSEPTISQLVAEGASLKASLTAQAARLKEIERSLITYGSGTHTDGSDGGAKAQVIPATVAISLPDNASEVDQLKELLGEHSGKVLESLRAYKLVKGFKDKITVLFKKREVNKILKLCTKPKAAYVKWS